MTEMSQWIENACIPALFIALMVYRTDAYSLVTLDASNCNSKTLFISHEQSQTIRWTGEVIPARCRVGFEATEAPYAICVDIDIFRVDHCSFTLGIYEDLAEYPVKRYDCTSTDTTEERCFDHTRIYLGFTFNNTGEFSYPSVKIEVKVKVDENAESVIEQVVCGLVAVVFLVGTTGVIFKVCREYMCGDIFERLCNCISCCLCGICKNISDNSCCMKVYMPNTTTTRENLSSGHTLGLSSEPEVLNVTGTLMNLSPGISWNSLDSLGIGDRITDDEVYSFVPSEDNGCSPPPYEDPPPDPSLTFDPPPSYYDVVTGNS
ncbi:uncharacterized protein LOC110465422 [Mizuhopecten yessoensis]|uniref:uncharacterized protein LOC110465422 n=1 Tax=Mizuhopecten yessoensis TaxID=6573 RepID=UPI000B4580EB|nr:uncharacterized protein LOC110465422 [Mizuhopecten yessoensis]XP_021376891.1 uncharacterized protein LOC110465422 [Mizuhopecten yessoensis]XP_021376892.1 uncharacterized protein LOC110465422 [Mizuhopecten yessoensis]XP_021376893.1 uncharacterized protein LOC110465422 [Mizuhopecten yessoensis]